jgi:hypothetical protein
LRTVAVVITSFSRFSARETERDEFPLLRLDMRYVMKLVGALAFSVIIPNVALAQAVIAGTVKDSRFSRSTAAAASNRV